MISLDLANIENGVGVAGCEYCSDDSKSLKNFKFPYCNMEVFITKNEMEINTYNHYTETNGITEDIYGSFPIRFCPMCGRNLEVEK